MIQRLGRVDEAGERGDDGEKGILSWRVRMSLRAQMDYLYMRVTAEPLGPMSRLEPCDGSVQMTPSHCFCLLCEMRSKVIHWQ